MGRVLRLFFWGPVILEFRIFRVPVWGLDSRGCEVRFGPGNATLVLSMKAHISAPCKPGLQKPETKIPEQLTVIFRFQVLHNHILCQI